MKKDIVRIVFLICAILSPIQISGQSRNGMILSDVTKTGIGYVNVGVIGKNIGTVSDNTGRFRFNLSNLSEKDSIRFSMIGFASRTFQVGQFKKDSISEIYLTPIVYNISELTVIYHKPRQIQLGSKVLSDLLRSGFSSNDLGSELAIKVKTKHQIKLKNINLNIFECTFDSVKYRLNVYKIIGDSVYKNILTKPVYLSFSKAALKPVMTFDLSQYSIIIEGDTMVALELYRDLGEGSLLFHTEYFTGYTYHRKSTEGKWVEASGEVGMYINGLVIN